MFQRNKGIWRSLAVAAILTAALACASSRTEAGEPNAEDRMAAVENGIDPPYVIAGEPAMKWSINKQLERYKVPEVSVAVINDYKIDWTKA